MADYISKMKGGGQCPPRMEWHEIRCAMIGSAIGICVCGYLSSRYFDPKDLTLIIGSLGASAALACGALKSPYSQPRCLVGGHIVSGLVGVACYYLFGQMLWLAAGLSVAFAILAMALTKTLHPPGGATALIFVIGGPKIHELGFLFPFVPAGLGALVLLAVALITNNIPKNRKYPEYWY